MNIRLILSALVASVALCATPGTTRAAQIFVTNFDTGTIGEYTTSGETVNPAVISGLSLPGGIAASRGNLFVASLNLGTGTGRIGEYTTSGATVNPALVTTLGGPIDIAASGDNLFVSISNVESESARIGKFTTSGAMVNDDLIPGLSIPLGIAVSGEDLFVVDWGNGKIGKYTTSGAIVNASLVSGLISPVDIAVSGENLFVTDSVTGTIGEYNATTGVTIDADLVSGLNGPSGIAVFGGNLFVTNVQTGTIGEYTMSGETVNASLISGLNDPIDIVVVSPTAADLFITQTASPDPVVVGSNLTYTLSITNSGPDTATSVTVTDDLPAEATFVSCSSTGEGVCDGSDNNRTVTFAALAAGQSESITFVVSVTCSVVDGTAISNTATVSSSTPDPDPNNDSATATTTASNPPPSISGAAADPSILWPPNHRMVNVTVSYAVTDNCPLPPTSCSLDVTSNEPIGHTSPDWIVLDANHVQLRAEREGDGNGRFYTITVSCPDSGGSSSSQSVEVRVPHDRGRR